MKELHQQIYDEIRKAVDERRPQPTIREIAATLGKAISTIGLNLKEMQRLGYIERRGARAIMLKPLPVAA